MTVAAEGLPALLDLETAGSDAYVGWCREGATGRVFGGHLAAQALLAAGRTVEPTKPVHSLHANFVHRGQPAKPIRYTVERLRDSRSFSTRRVTASQGADIVFHLSASFQVPEPGSVDHQLDRPVIPPPDQAPTLFRHPIEVRSVNWSPPADAADQRLTEQHLWVRSPVPLPDEPLLHACTMVFASDMTVGWSPWKVSGIHAVTPDMFGASLDHAMWFHRPFRADEWLLLHQSSPSASAGRGLSLAQVYDPGGRLVITAAQEGVVRLGAVARVGTAIPGNDEPNAERRPIGFSIGRRSRLYRSGSVAADQHQGVVAHDRPLVLRRQFADQIGEVGRVGEALTVREVRAHHDRVAVAQVLHDLHDVVLR